MKKYKLGKHSLERLSTCSITMQGIVKKAITLTGMDFGVLEGHRGEKRQNMLFDNGRSKLRWPDGKHNKKPSDAADIAPMVNGRVSWHIGHCCLIAGAMFAAASILGVEIRWGGNWDMDGEPITDQKFQDLVHFEIVR